MLKWYKLYSTVLLLKIRFELSNIKLKQSKMKNRLKLRLDG